MTYPHDPYRSGDHVDGQHLDDGRSPSHGYPGRPPRHRAPEPADGYPPAPHPPKTGSGGRAALIVLGCIVGLCLVVGVIGSLAGGGGTTGAEAVDSADPTAGPAAAEPSKAPARNGSQLNTPFRDGKFEFTVTGVQCGVRGVGGEYEQKPQGEFCLVTVTVKNIGDEAGLFDSSGQKAFGPRGQQYTADSAAGLAANPNGETFINEITPGDSAIGKLVFDIPVGGRIAKLELHDLAFSGGVDVRLS